MMMSFAFLGQPPLLGNLPTQINPAGPPGRDGAPGTPGAAGAPGKDGTDGATQDISGKLDKTGGALSGPLSQATPATGSTTDGGFATDGTQSWEPTTFGNFLAQGMTLVVNPTRGTTKDGSGNPASTFRTPNLIQAKGNGVDAVSPNGQVINFDVVGGAYSQTNAPNGVTNSVGQTISVRQRPGPNGERPGYTWGQNIDFHVAPNAGAVQSYGTEIDMNNFNQDAYAGASSLVAHIFLNGIAAYPGTAYIYAGPGSTTSFTGTITTAGTAVTRVSGSQFTSAIKRITIAGAVYRVNFVDATHLTITSAAPADNATPVAYSANSDMVHDGILFSGTTCVSDNDVHLGTSAYNGVLIDGQHNICINTSADTSSYGLVMKAGQGVYFNVFAGGLSYSTAKAGLSYNNGAVVLGDNGLLSASVVATAADANVGGNVNVFGGILINGAAGTKRRINLLTANSGRWDFGADNSAETGSAAGSNFYIQAHADDGSFGAVPLTINRATGKTTLTQLAVSGASGFNGATPVGKQTLSAALPTDGSASSAQLATAYNSLRTALINLGLAQ